MALWLFVAFAAFYLLGGGGHINTPDGVVMYRVTRAMVERGATDIDTSGLKKGFGGTAVRDPATGASRFYAKYGLGYSLAGIPGYLVGRLLRPLASDGERRLFDTAHTYVDGEPRRHNPFRVQFYAMGPEAFDDALTSFTVSWTNSFVTAAIVALIFATCLALGFASQPSVATAVTAGLATPLWHYSKTSFSEPLAGLCLLAFFYAALRAASAQRSGRWLFVSGLAMGLGLLTKVAQGVELLPAALLLFAYGRRVERGKAVRGAAAWIAGFVIPIVVILVYNWSRFDSPWESGYAGEVARWTTPLFTGLTGLLVSPGRGLLIYCPVLLVAGYALPASWRRHKPETLFALTSVCVLLLLYSRWYMWEGGWCWGPRFLIPILPLAVLPLAAVFEGARELAPLRRRVLAGIGLASAVVAFNGIIVNFNDFDRWIRMHFERDYPRFQAAGVESYYDLMQWDWLHAPVVRYWTFFVRDYFLLHHAVKSPGLVLGLFVVFLVVLVVATRRLLRLLTPMVPR